MVDRYDTLRTAIMQDLDVDPATPITGDMSGQDAAKVFLAGSILKKQEAGYTASQKASQEQAALKLFLESNSVCQDWSWRPDHVMDDVFVGELRSFLAELLDPQHEPAETFDLQVIAREMGPGPGAAVGANSENFYTKVFESQLTCTSEYLFSLYRAAACERPYWAEAEEVRFKKYGFRVVNGSTYFSVAKNREIERSCATEPNINMMFQKALGNYIEQRLVRVLNLNIHDQEPLNQLLAREGSISGLLGTIDLKSASDRNSMAMVEYFFPRNIVKWVKLFRSPTCRLPSGQELNMEMCSTMGNGFTFPLQTALFAGVVVTCYKLLGIGVIRNRWARRVKPSRDGLSRFEYQDRKVPGNFAVYGDDIIVRSDAYDYVCRQLRKLGHTVNDAKSFNSGGFRESCGSDWFYGYNVRGIYIKSLETPLDVYSAINRLTRWSARHDVNLSRCIRVLLGWVKFLPVPFGAADVEGVKVPYDPAYQPRPKKTERQVVADAEAWQCYLYRGIAVQAQSREVPTLTGSNPELVEPANDLASCEAGWVVSALGGYCATPPYRLVREDPDVAVTQPSQLSSLKLRIGIRPKPDTRVRWKVRLKTAHCWPSVPQLPGPVIGTDRGHTWESVAARHEFLKYL